MIGISSEKEKLGRDNVKLIYLFFKPKTSDEAINQQIEKIFGDLADEIKKIFESEHIRDFAKKYNICLDAIAEHSEIMESVMKSDMIKLYFGDEEK